MPYPHWGIVSPHAELVQLPALQEVIGQVWSGTAKTATRLGGVRAERTFDLAMLEYNSLFNLVRGSDKRLWFLLDPVEDTPGLPLQYYRRNFHQTLVAALMIADELWDARAKLQGSGAAGDAVGTGPQSTELAEPEPVRRLKTLASRMAAGVHEDAPKGDGSTKPTSGPRRRDVA